MRWRCSQPTQVFGQNWFGHVSSRMLENSGNLGRRFVPRMAALTKPKTSRSERNRSRSSPRHPKSLLAGDSKPRRIVQAGSWKSTPTVIIRPPATGLTPCCRLTRWNPLASGRRNQYDGLKRKRERAMKILMQAIVIAHSVAQQQWCATAMVRAVIGPWRGRRPETPPASMDTRLAAAAFGARHWPTEPLRHKPVAANDRPSEATDSQSSGTRLG